MQAEEEAAREAAPQLEEASGAPEQPGDAQEAPEQPGDVHKATQQPADDLRETGIPEQFDDLSRWDTPPPLQSSAPSVYGLGLGLQVASRRLGNDPKTTQASSRLGNEPKPAQASSRLGNEPITSEASSRLGREPITSVVYRNRPIFFTNPDGDNFSIDSMPPNLRLAIVNAISETTKVKTMKKLFSDSEAQETTCLMQFFKSQGKDPSVFVDGDGFVCRTCKKKQRPCIMVVEKDQQSTLVVLPIVDAVQIDLSPRDEGLYVHP